MAQDIVNYLLPIAVLLLILGFNDARLARKHLRILESRLADRRNSAGSSSMIWRPGTTR